MKTETKPYDPTLFIKTDEDTAAYLNEAYMDEDPTVFLVALGDVAKIKGMSKVAKKAGLNRESLYKSLKKTGNPKFSTISKVSKALGCKLTVV